MFEEKVYRSSGALVKMARMAGPKSRGLRERSTRLPMVVFANPPRAQKKKKQSALGSR